MMPSERNKILLSHAGANQNVINTALALAESDMLKEFVTCIAWDNEHWINKLLPSSIRKKLSCRSLPHDVFIKTRTIPWPEIARLAFSFKLNFLTSHERGIFSYDAVDKKIDLKVAARLAKYADIQSVYAYENGALNTFKSACESGLKCIYELPIGYWRAARKIYLDEAELNPGWAATLTGLKDSDEKLKRKDEELLLADIVLIPSSFVEGTLKEAPSLKARVKIIPYGAPPVFMKKDENRSRTKNFKIIFVGGLTQRKGISYLLEAVSNLGDRVVDLTILGSKPPVTCLPLEKAIAKHRWVPSLPHAEVLKLMRDHDALVLPSLFEGFGLVILEAMSQGLPVIATPNTCAPDIISDGVDGFIVPIRSSDAIAERILSLIQNKELLISMGNKAMEKASFYTWERYRNEVVRTLNQK